MGVLRLDGGPVHRVPQRGVAGASRDAGPARPGRTITVDDEATCGASYPRTRGSPTSATRRRPRSLARDPDGPAFTVGDLGRVDEDGYVHLDGRREDLIISGGVNVYPAEVEHVLGELDGVEDVAVFGVEDDHWGQRVCAAVVGTADDEAIDAHAREHLAPAKRPKEFHRLDELPRTPTGKVRRLDLPTSWLADGLHPRRARGVPRRRGARPAARPRPGPAAAVRRDQPRPVDRGDADPLRAPGQPLLPGPAAGRHPHRAGRPLRRDDRGGPRPVPRARAGDHQPGPPRQCQGLRPPREELRAGGEQLRSLVWQRGPRSSRSPA